MLRATHTAALPLALLLCSSVPDTAVAISNIDPQGTGQKFAWTENGGWMNLQGDPTHGVRVGAMVLEGFAWHENFGWINFGDGTPNGDQYSNISASDFGVNIDETGNLFGYAWGENIGWINFDTTSASGTRVTIIQSTGQFIGYAWSENAGWISFSTVDPLHVAHTVSDSRVTDWTLFE